MSNNILSFMHSFNPYHKQRHHVGIGMSLLIELFLEASLLLGPMKT